MHLLIPNVNKPTIHMTKYHPLSLCGLEEGDKLISII